MSVDPRNLVDLLTDAEREAIREFVEGLPGGTA